MVVVRSCLTQIGRRDCVRVDGAGQKRGGDLLVGRWVDRCAGTYYRKADGSRSCKHSIWTAPDLGSRLVSRLMRLVRIKGPAAHPRPPHPRHCEPSSSGTIECYAIIVEFRENRRVPDPPKTSGGIRDNLKTRHAWELMLGIINAL
uniref:Uncharacterized protein n=1 Tax=Plectus sambesii TaxID=2011161 RepID=A0A914UM70_9BILA